MNEGHEPIPNFNPYTRRGKALIAKVKTMIPGLTTNEAVHCLKTGVWARPRPTQVVGSGPVLAYRVPGIYTEIVFKQNETERQLIIENSQARGESMIQALRRLERGRP